MKKDIEAVLNKQREFFASGKTRDVEFRIQALEKLEKTIAENENEIAAALMSDLNKSSFESYMCETGLTLSELRYVKRHLRKWAKSKRVHTPVSQFHGCSYTMPSPYGSVLIMSPWNYPVMLTLEPLAGAIAAGNCCVVKPSAYSPNTSAVIERILGQIFPDEYVAVVTGGREENEALLNSKFDYIFFTGSPSVGKTVMKKAAENLTPVTLELGGKSPCIVDASANMEIAARRIVFGKFLNAGQTCVAPDYILAEKSIKDELIEKIIAQIKLQFGQKPIDNRDYVSIINEKHFDRVLGLIDAEKTVFGGEADRSSLKISPTVMDGVDENDPVMLQEIFGPVLPVMTVDNADDAAAFVNARPHPLALYLFTGSRETEEKVMGSIEFGGGCVNDTIIHLATPYMGFGGVGQSGMGSYHGKKSFDTFSHEKSIVKKYAWFDMPVRYQPYTSGKNRLLRKFLR